MGNPETGDLPPLPFAEVEAQLVGRFAPDADVRLGALASERYLKSRSLADVGVLHFATHAIVDDWVPDRTALALSAGEGDDGHLGPGEILGLSLTADLIVLSACRSAAGPVVRGEGVQGLTAPLLAAGARAIVATLWSVRDEAALGLIRRFYQELATGVPVADALRAAKLDAIRRGASPRDWGPFTVVGDPMVRVSLEAPRDRLASWGIPAGLLALVTGVVWLVRRRATA
jgi:CHAT domain-containing protein